MLPTRLSWRAGLTIALELWGVMGWTDASSYDAARSKVARRVTLCNNNSATQSAWHGLLLHQSSPFLLALWISFSAYVYILDWAGKDAHNSNCCHMYNVHCTTYIQRLILLTLQIRILCMRFIAIISQWCDVNWHSQEHFWRYIKVPHKISLQPTLEQNNSMWKNLRLTN